MEQTKLPIESTLIIKNLRNHLAGRAVGISNDQDLLEEVLKIFFCFRLYSERYKNTTELLSQAKKIREDFAKIKKLYPDLYKKTDEVFLDPKSIGYTIGELRNLETFSKNRKIDVVAALYQAFIGNHIRGQEGQFFTPVVAIDFLIKSVDPKPEWKIIDTACGACSFLSSIYLYLLGKYPQEKIREFVKNNLHGIEKDKELSRLAKIHLTLLTGEDPKIVTGDSLLIEKENRYPHLKDSYFDLVITNPPFGSKIKAADHETALKYKLGYKWERQDKKYISTNSPLSNTPPQVLFTERNIRALKPGGILATVIPESLVSNKGYKSAAQFTVDSCDVLAMIGMPESLFKTSGKGGTHTKTCLMIAQKKKTPLTQKNRKIFMAEAKWCGHDSRGNSIPKNDMPMILDNYIAHQENKLKSFSPLGYLLSIEEIEDLIFAPRYYDIEFTARKDYVSKENNLITFGELIKQEIISISTGDEIGKLSYGTGEIPYIRTSDISNWETKIDNKHNVSRDIYERYKKKQDIKSGDILMVKDGTYLIGTVAMITKIDEEMLYQSHIYKIRVNENKIGLTPYNLFAILSSDFLQRQIKSKQLTQDIIDSLGRRIFDLQIPIPKQKKVFKDLDLKIKNVFRDKEAAKKQIYEATKTVNSLF